MNRGKRRDNSQRIGRVGESIFTTWATRNHLSANKLEEDFGIDFNCAELEQVTSRGEEITGNSVSCQVRTTEGTDVPRIGVDRIDVETALRQKGPYCLVGVHEPTEKVYFKFLDEALLLRWAEFLQSKSRSMSFRLEEMNSGQDEFISELRRLARPITRMKLSKLSAQIGIKQLLPGAELFLNNSDYTEHALVVAPRFGNIWHTKTAKEEEQIARSIFSLSPLEKAIEQASRQFQLHPNLVNLSALTDGDIHLAMPMEKNVTLFVEGENRVTVSATLRQFNDTRAYILESGLVLQISQSKRDGKALYHEVSFNLIEEDAQSLGSSADLAFLRELRPGAKWNEDGRTGIDVQAFELHRIGAAIKAIEGVSRGTGIPLDEFKLADLNDAVFSTNLAVLQALLFNQPTPAPRGFVFGIPDDQLLDEQAWRRCIYLVPIVLGLKGRTICIWLQGEGKAYTPEKTIHGFQFNQPQDFAVETKEFPPIGDGSAVMCVYKSWPAVPLTAYGETFVVRREGDLPLEGEFRLVP